MSMVVIFEAEERILPNSAIFQVKAFERLNCQCSGNFFSSSFLGFMRNFQGLSMAERQWSLSAVE